MSMVFNPPSAASMGAQSSSAKDQKSGYVGIDSNGDSAIIRDFKVEGKAGFNGAAPVAKTSAYTQTYGTASRSHVEEALATNLSLTLVTEVVPVLNAQNKCINELKKLVNQLIDDLQAVGVVG